MKPKYIFIFSIFFLIILPLVYSSAIKLELSEPAIDGKSVVVNGYVSSTNGAITELFWDWGDKTKELLWFPASHVYKKEESYLLKVTAQDIKGENFTVERTINLQSNNSKPELVTVEGKYTGFYDFPKDYFDQASIPKERVVEITDIFYKLLREAHVVKAQKIKFIWDPSFGGAYADSRNNKIGIGSGFQPKNMVGNNHAWSMYIHEMSHVIGDKKKIFLNLAENGYSAFLDEHQAVVNVKYVYRKVLNNKNAYGLSKDEISSLKATSQMEDDLQEKAYKTYISNGKKFYIFQDKIDAAGLTGQALNHLIFEIVKTRGENGIKQFDGFLSDGLLTKVGFSKKIPSQEELANYVTASYSISYDLDLRNEFKTKLNFPINDLLYENYYSILVGKGPVKCLEKWSCGSWSSCLNNTQSRTCMDINKCDTLFNKPIEIQSCKTVPNDWKRFINKPTRVFITGETMVIDILIDFLINKD